MIRLAACLFTHYSWTHHSHIHITADPCSNLWDRDRRILFLQPAQSCSRSVHRYPSHHTLTYSAQSTTADMSSATPTLYGLGSIPQQLYGVAISLLVITWTTFLARAYVRGYLLRSAGWDDWTLIPAQICYTVQCGYMISMARMESDPEHNSSIREIPQLVTVSEHSVQSSGPRSLTDLPPELGSLCWDLRADLHSPQDLPRPFLPPHYH